MPRDGFNPKIFPTRRTALAALQAVCVAGTFAVLGVTIGPTDAGSQPVGATPNARQIFDRAWQQWSSQRPPFVRYTVLCAKIVKSEACPTEYVQITTRTSDGRTYVQTAPSGSETRILVRGGRITFAGLSIGLFLSSRSQYATNSSVAHAPYATNALRVIATVHNDDIPYDVTLDGIAPVDGSDAYQLTLRPRSDPEIYPLRKLRVDVATYNVRSVTYERTPGNNTFFLTYDFAPAGPGRPWWVAHISWDDTLRILLFNRRTNGSIDLRDVTFPKNLPPQDFNRASPAAPA